MDVFIVLCSYSASGPNTSTDPVPAGIFSLFDTQKFHKDPFTNIFIYNILYQLYIRLHFTVKIRKDRLRTVVGYKELLKKYKNKYEAGSHFKSCSISTADFPLESNDILISLQKIYYPVRRVIRRSILLLRMGQGLSKVLAMAPRILRNLLYCTRFDNDG